MENQLPAKARRMLAEASARISVRDIKRLHALRDEISAKWWEWAIGLAIFPAALGFFMTLVQLVESGDFFEGRQRVILRFYYIWSGLFVLALLASYETLSRKQRAMKQYLREFERELDESRREREELRALLKAMAEGAASPSAQRKGGDQR